MSELFSIHYDGDDFVLKAPGWTPGCLLDERVTESLIRVIGLYSEALGANLETRKHYLERKP